MINVERLYLFIFVILSKNRVVRQCTIYDNKYKELSDSVEYSNYLSEIFRNTDDFSENSKFEEDIDSAVSLEDIF
ncbi:hypothetical protein H8356DRAFT_1437083 [Neocallimastix lanati (nom. inval.)]|nr:hypothetical protein H8356DRAFT_1438073 [Neocallimastix sp. JGI-2020a]KAG4083286.1 hypothetical protein H8356DRAFT_1437083 [Neocallimastix sp. JGI-2020a]